jgi:cell division protein FtsI/penicillin-binding protein 2
MLAMLLLAGLGYAFLLQVTYHADFAQVADAQHRDSIIPLPGRGRIYDAQGRAVALTRTSYRVRVLPQYLKDEARCTTRTAAAHMLAEIGGRDFGSVLGELRSRHKMYVFAADMDYDAGERLKRAVRRTGTDNAILVEPLKTRVYRYGDTLGSVVGFAQRDSGKVGLEAVLDSVLSGIPGKVIVQKDGLGNSYRFPDYPDVQPVNGADVCLTIDVDFQRVAYEELKACVDSFRADQGSAIVLDCRTGEVKALCDYPYCDPRRPAKTGAGSRPGSVPSFYCRAAEQSFEPGSAFKPALGLAALESPDAARLKELKFDVSKGVIELCGKKIHDVHPCGVQDFAGIFIHSSNVGLVMLSGQVARSTYFLTMRRLGFGQPCGIELVQEDPGYLDAEYRTAPETMSPLRVANNAFGQGVMVTLLQLANCYAAIANDGLLKRPFLVKEIRNADSVVYRGEPLTIRRAVSVRAAREMKEILARVVTEGTGQVAGSPYFAVCGKTGTGEKALPGRGYKDGQIIVTFVGFFPKDDPEYVVAISADNPRIGKYAGTIVGPAFRRISEQCYWFADRTLAMRNGTGGMRNPPASR